LEKSGNQTGELGKVEAANRYTELNNKHGTVLDVLQRKYRDKTNRTSSIDCCLPLHFP